MALLPRKKKFPLTVDEQFTITANRTLKQSENGATVIFNSTTSLVATLPAPLKGLRYRFVVKTAASSGVGHLVKVAGSTEKIYGKVSPTGAAISESAGKGVVNTQATEVKGDFVAVESDGTDWFIVGQAGTWAREA